MRDRQSRSIIRLSIQRPRPSIEILTFLSRGTSGKSVLVDGEPWSELTIFGLPYFASAASSASTQDPASIEFDNRQLSTFRLCQSMTATRSGNPATHREASDVGTADLMRPGDGQVAKQVWINLVFRVVLAGPGFLVDRHKTHEAHEPPHRVATASMPLESVRSSVYG